MSEQIDQIDCYLDGELSAPQVATLRQWINADRANARAFAQRAVLHQEIRAILHRSRVQTVQQPKQLLQELLEHEQNAETDLVEVHTLIGSPRRFTERLTATFTKPEVITGIAAVVILSLSLFFILSIGNDETSTAVSPTPDTPFAQSPDTTADLTPVATLTATKNATWAEGASAPGSLITGSKLSPNQRLTLTAGFAEITTNDGAIAMLEAPATVELLDNNAVRLHTGRLVGICRTDSSKGFIVKTPYADVTDLGTEFGVQVLAGQVTTTVFSGEVVVNTPGGEPEHLTANQTARLTVNGSNREMIVQDDLAQGFATLLSRTTATEATLPITGAGVAVGQPDPNWQLVAIDGQALNQPQALTVQAFEFALPGSAARWIAFDVSPGTPFAQDKGSLIYTFRAEVDVLNPAEFKYAPRFLADHSVKAIRLNGKPQTVESEGKIRPFRSSGKTGTSVFADAFITGTNVIEIEVSNFNTNANQDFVGLILDWQPINEPQNTP